MPASSNHVRHKTRYPGVYFRTGRDGRRAYQVTWRDEQGKQHWARAHGDIDAARAALDDRRREVEERKRRLRAGEPVNLEGTFAEMVESYKGSTPWLELRPGTAKTYARMLTNHVLPTFADVAVRDIDTRSIRRWITALQRGGRLRPRKGEGPGLKAWTIHGALTPFRCVLARAVDEGLIRDNPVNGLRRRDMPEHDEREVRVLDRDALERLWAAAAERFRLPFKVKAYTGLRSAELRGLVWADLDLDTDAGLLTLTRQVDDDGERVEPKTKKAKRLIPLPRGLVKLLREHKLASHYSAETDFVFAADDGSAMTYPTLRGGFVAAVRKSGLGPDPGLTLHSLRHGYGSRLIANGRSAAMVSRLMGHSKLSTTLDLYTHEFESRATEEDTALRAEEEREFGSAAG